jgi:integrase
MARQITKRSEWRRTKSGAWTCSLGERGTRVRLFQKRKNGVYFRGVWRAKVGAAKGYEDQAALATKDQAEAMRLGRLLLAELLRGEVAATKPAPLTLGRLWQRYSTECAEYLDNKARSQKGAEASARVLLGHFGESFVAEDFERDHQRAFERARMAGGIVTTSGDETRPTRARSAESDVALLHMMLSWATTVRAPGGGYLLNRNPLRRVKRVREKNKKQPAATWERYEATTAAMGQLGAEAVAAEDDDARIRWARMEFALFLAESTGHRLGSIRQLRWEDFRYEAGVVHWRAEADKKGYRWDVRMSATFFERVKAFQRELGAVGGYVFAAPKAREGIMDRHLFDKWLSVAEKKAGLPKLDGGLWHAYRRKWAIERKHLPARDVAAAGGWKDVSTLLEVYQQADDESILAVTSETRKLRERGVA